MGLVVFYNLLDKKLADNRLALSGLSLAYWTAVSKNTV